MDCESTSNTGRNRGERQIEVLSNNESCRTGMASGLSLLGGLAIGAGLMYLLDPEEGADRRIPSVASPAAQSPAVAQRCRADGISSRMQPRAFMTRPAKARARSRKDCLTAQSM